MIQIALCDDDPVELEQAHRLLERYSLERPAEELSLRAFESPKALMNEVLEQRFCDIYILDVKMPEMDGIELGRCIRECNDACLIIYQTVTPDYAFEAYNVSAFHYLLKPLTRARLFPVLDRAVSQLERREGEGMVVRTAEGISFVPYHCLSYVEQRNRAVEFHLLTGRSVTSLCLRGAMGKYLADLLEDGRFLQPHKSYLVNMDSIRRMEPDAIVLAGGEVIPISKHRSAGAKKQYLDYLAHKARAASLLPAAH